MKPRPPVDFAERREHNRCMPAPEARFPSQNSLETTLRRRAAIILVGVVLWGPVTACARRDASPPQNEHGALQAPPAAPAGAAQPQRWEGGATAEGANAPETLIEAARQGDAKAVESILAHGAERKTLNEALLTAAASEPLVIDVFRKEVSVDSPYTAVVKLLLAKGASLDARGEAGRTPLIFAAGNGETGVVKLLIEKGANIEATDDSGQTALILAACYCTSVNMPIPPTRCGCC